MPLLYIVIDTGEFYTTEMIQEELNRLAKQGYEVDQIIPGLFKGDDNISWDARIILKHKRWPARPADEFEIERQ